MSGVGLVYVGAVLFINGIMLLGWLTPQEAGPLNLFVGALQVFTPTYLIVVAGSAADIFAASGIYLFGFTYLWVGINALKNYRNRGFGWFALVVAACTLVYAADSFLHQGDAGFGVIWLLWGVLWFLFFLVLGLERTTLGPATGVYTIVTAILTAIAAYQVLLGTWSGGLLQAVVFAAIGLLALIFSGALAPALSTTEEVVT